MRHAREILSRLNEAGGELRDIAEGRLGQVPLGVLPSAAVVLVLRFIARRQPDDASVSISVTEGTMATLLPALRADTRPGRRSHRPSAPAARLSEEVEPPRYALRR